MKTTLHCFITLLIIIGYNFTSQAQDSIEKKVKIVMEENNIPSLSIGIVKNGDIVFLKGFGVKSRKDSTEVIGNSIFQIASQSKMFTGIIVNNLIQEGKLDINEPITTYFSNKITDENKKRLKKIKLINLLNHTAGLSRDGFSVYRNRIEGEAWRKGYSKAELVDDINKIEIEFEPGSKFQYSNSDYAVVGYICENVSGLNYEELLRKYITDRYNLKNTVVNLNEKQEKMLVTPYKKSERNIATKSSIMGMATPASAIYSNAVDLSNILSDQINSYRLNEEKETQSPLILTKQTSEMNEGLQYGFGLIKETKGDNIKYGHGGDADGFACEYFFNPTENIGVVILTSSGGRWVGELANEILEDLK